MSDEHTSVYARMEAARNIVVIPTTTDVRELQAHSAVRALVGSGVVAAKCANNRGSVSPIRGGLDTNGVRVRVGCVATSIIAELNPGS